MPHYYFTIAVWTEFVTTVFRQIWGREIWRMRYGVLMIGNNNEILEQFFASCRKSNHL